MKSDANLRELGFRYLQECDFQSNQFGQENPKSFYLTGFKMNNHSINNSWVYIH